MKNILWIVGLVGLIGQSEASISKKNTGNGTKVRRNGLLYQPPREDSILGSRSLKLFKRNGQPKTGGLASLVNLTHDDKMSLVHAANLRRAAVKPTASNMKYVKWDDTLAASAAVHAKRCQFAHSTPDQLYHPIYRHQIGENLAVFRGPKSFVNDLFIWIVDGFYEERKYYDYESSSCTAECGHYEVLVHAEQERMGCAVSTCSSVVDAFKKLHRTELGDSPFFIVVCHYAPVVLTPTLYDKGQECTNCPSGWDFCTMGLCSQQKEEEPQRSLAGLKLDAGMEDLSVGNIYVWGQWSSCTRSCGSGIQWRFRMCEGCKGPEGEMRTCNHSACTSQGWAQWANWGSCSATCGKDSTRMRGRKCMGGINAQAVCAGVSAQYQTCSLPTCSQWVEWGQWNTCTVSCGNGTRRRQRKCAKSGKDKCIGSSAQTEICSPGPCGGRWEFWSEWSECSVSCGSGVQTRSRICEGGQVGRGNCIGDAKEKKECHDGMCGTVRSPVIMDNHCQQTSKKMIQCDGENFEALPIFSSQFSDRRDGTNRFMKGVTQLDFSNNSISDLSALPMACKMLRGKVDVLNLKNNSIEELDGANFENCSQIKRLILTGNPIKSFNPMIFQKMKRLSSLEIDFHDDACWSTKDVMAFAQISKKLKMTLKAD